MHSASLRVVDLKKIFLVSGFLGVGKTTLIMDILDNLPKDQTTMMIENDFGSVNLDSMFLKGYDLKITEINAGCICCSLVGDFEKAIVEIERDYNPNNIIIEPSGVANTSQLVNIALALDYDYHLNSINIIDVRSHFLYLKNFKEFYENQILSANIIVINRVEKMTDEEIEKVRESLNAINEAATVFVDRGDLDIGEIISDKNIYKKIYDADMNIENIFTNYSSISLILPKRYKNEVFLKAIDSIIEAGGIKRIKGIVNLKDGTYKVDYVLGDEVKLEPYKHRGVGKIAFIGENYDKMKIKDIFGR